MSKLERVSHSLTTENNSILSCSLPHLSYLGLYNSLQRHPITQLPFPLKMSTKTLEARFERLDVNDENEPPANHHIKAKV